MKNLSDNEVRQLLDAVDRRDAFAARDEALLVLLLHTGLRPGECLALDVRQVATGGVPRQTLHVPSSIGKCGLERVVPLNARAREAVQALLAFNAGMGWSVADSAPLAYSRNGNRLCIRALQYVVAGLRKRAQLDVPATPHALRHTFASNLLGKSGNVRAVQVVLGHQRITSTQIYARPSRESLAQAVELLAQ